MPLEQPFFHLFINAQRVRDYINIQICNLADSMLRNITDNFINVSFNIKIDGCIQTKIVLDKRTTKEDDYIEDIGAEFFGVTGI